jgi:predicted outer membrane repeat protein
LLAHRRLPSWSVVAAALVISLVLAAGTRPRAALAAPTYTVTSGGDTTGGSCAAGSSTCTFRLAVQNANVNPGSTINVTSGLVIVFGSGNPQIDINTATTIQTTGAAAATIDGTSAILGVLRVVATSPVTISGLNIQNSSKIIGGGAITTVVGAGLTLNNLTLSGNKCFFGSGGAINNSGSLGLHNVSVTNNGGATCSFGGGIFTSGPLMMQGGSVTGNTAAINGGGIYVTTGAGNSLTATGTSITNNTAGQDGGGIYATGPVSLTGANLSNNTATLGGGGGMFATAATASLADSTVNGNQSTGSGGGLAVISSQLTVSRSTFSTNRSHAGALTGLGGGIFMSSSSGSLTNSTLAGNSADSGGGLYTGSSSLSVGSATIVGNSAPTGAGVFVAATSSLGLHNTILAYTPSNCTGSVTSQGYNIDTANTCTLAGPGDQPNTDPNLLPLGNNGGSTQTMALLATSPAINAGDPACPPPGTDQRGTSRPQGPRCDIGAYELVSSIPPPVPAPPSTGRN